MIVGERSSITSAYLGGMGALSQNANTADAEEGVGREVQAKMLLPRRGGMEEFMPRAKL